MESLLKTRPLPDLDLARIAPLQVDDKRRELERLKLGRPPYSYAPMRRSILDILNIEAGPLAPVSRAPWSLIRSEIQRDARSEVEAKANIAVGEALYTYVDENAIAGRRYEIYPLNIGVTEKVVYWSQAVVSINGRAVVPFIDPRRTTKRLTVAARRFVFSVMHERIRVADPDLADVGLCIIQFQSLDDGARAPALHFADRVELLSFETLDQMVQETYAIWHEVLEERDADTRRRGTGTHGPLI
jgi:hypothetical protein